MRTTLGLGQTGLTSVEQPWVFPGSVSFCRWEQWAGMDATTCLARNSHGSPLIHLAPKSKGEKIKKHKVAGYLGQKGGHSISMAYCDSVQACSQANSPQWWQQQIKFPLDLFFKGKNKTNFLCSTLFLVVRESKVGPYRERTHSKARLTDLDSTLPHIRIFWRAFK